MTSAAKDVYRLADVQRRRRRMLMTAALALALLLPFIGSEATGETLLHEILEVLSIFMIAAAIIGRIWCTLYIGGRKSREIVALGPYSISRNPLYLFSFIGVAGIGAQTGSVVIVVVVLALMLAIFLPVIHREEKALFGRFGAEYEAYRARVPRFGPSFSTWRDAEMVTVSPRLFWRTSRDVLLFFLIVPMWETVEWLQEAGHIVPLLHLP